MIQPLLSTNSFVEGILINNQKLQIKILVHLTIYAFHKAGKNTRLDRLFIKQIGFK